MGFMDKAKKLAEQAQEKLDEAQKSFGQGDAKEEQGSGGVRYDEHGRPIEEGPPAGTAPPPSGEPPAAPAEAAQEGEEQGPAEEPAPPPPKPPESGGSESNPDPFKPIQ
jgi:hypothetical protein